MTNTETTATHANFYEWDGTHRIDVGHLDPEGTIQVTDTFITPATSLAEASELHPDLIWDEVQW